MNRDMERLNGTPLSTRVSKLLVYLALSVLLFIFSL